MGATSTVDPGTPRPPSNPSQDAAVGEAIREAIEALTAEWHDEAILACERALKTDPACAEAVFLLGLVNFDLNEPVVAIALLEKAHELRPEVAEFADALAAILVRLGKVSDGLYYAKLATTLSPHPTIRNLLPPRFGSFFGNMRTGNPHLYLNRAERRLESGLYSEAVEDCRRQLDLTPDDTATWRVLARASLQIGKFEAAISSFHAVLHADTPRADDLADLGIALAATGRLGEAAACQATALDMAPSDPVLHSRIIANLVRRPGTSQAHLTAAHSEWRTRHAEAIRPRPVAPVDPQDADRPLRIAYLSGELYHSDFIEIFAPLVRLHKRRNVQVYCYSDGGRSDAISEALMRSADKWTDITGIDDETMWQILRGDEIDVAVDLSGHMPGGRPLVFARRPAPVTVSWLGNFYPLGLAGLDYFLTDETTWPDSEGDGEVWRIPRTAFAYVSPSGIPAASSSPAAQTGKITFGVSCDLGLLVPEQVRYWARMLWDCDSTSLLICNRFDHDQASIERVLDLFSHFGLRNRVDVVNMSENFHSEFAFYDHIDIALDTGSFASLVENCRALWMGVPVIAVAGEHPAARQGASLLTGAGRPEWVAQTPEELTAIAGTLGGDVSKLAELRATLRDEVQQQPLGDPVGLAGALEEAYRAMWRKVLGAR